MGLLANKISAKKGSVGKLRFQHTGPLETVDIPPGSVYSLCHCCKQNTSVKKKSNELSPYLDKLVAMSPLAGCDIYPLES